VPLLADDDGKKAIVATQGAGDFEGKRALGPLHLKDRRSSCPVALQPKIKRLIPIPRRCVDYLKRASETGVGYQAVSIELKDVRFFDQVLASEGCLIEVRGYNEILFGSPADCPLTRVANPVHRPRACSISRLLDISAISRNASAGFIR